jgi:hypothetical protein
MLLTSLQEKIKCAGMTTQMWIHSIIDEVPVCFPRRTILNKGALRLGRWWSHIDRHSKPKP